MDKDSGLTGDRAVNSDGDDLDNINKKLLGIIDSRTALINDVSHEMRNPVHALCNISEYLLANFEKMTQEDLKGQINFLHKNSLRIKDLINELLDFSKFQAGKMIFSMENFDFGALVTEIVEECRNLYINNKELNIIFSSVIQKAVIYGDSNRLAQVMRNLITNAAKYSDHGKVSIILDTKSLDNKNYIKFTVIDEGVGIASDQLELIFKPFERGSRTDAKIGTGLGLSISKEIIEAHHGKIWAENNKTIGAKFSFIVPCLI